MRLFTLLPLLLVWSCDFNRPLYPLAGYESSDEECSDGLDNDEDGFIDCDDPVCLAKSTLCGPFINEGDLEAEDSYALCRDKVDNDDDGNFDCGDRKCQLIQELCCTREFTNAACSDGIDNDGNGFTDCGDFGCSKGMFVTVCDEKRLPMSLPQGQQLKQGQESSLAECQDGQDNDGDSRVDCDDWNCTRTDEGASPEAIEFCFKDEERSGPECQDGQDNDGDGYTDCADWSCFKVDNGASQEALEHCNGGEVGAESTLEECSDGIDNDGNNFTDCADYSCSRADRGASEEAVAYCQAQAEASYVKCSDGIDNDGNGYTDCADYSCTRSDDESVKMACQESAAAVVDPESCDDPCVQGCGDGACAFYCSVNGVRSICRDTCADDIDNDQDGFKDCADWDCSYNPEKSCPGPGICEQPR